LQARHDLHQALLHRLLDVIAAAGRLNTRQSVVEDVTDHRVGFRGHLHDLADVALREHRHDLVPGAAIADRDVGQVDVALDGDCQAHHEHDGDRVHEVPATLEEAHDQIPKSHRCISHGLRPTFSGGRATRDPDIWRRATSAGTSTPN